MMMEEDDDRSGGHGRAPSVAMALFSGISFTGPALNKSTSAMMTLRAAPLHPQQRAPLPPSFFAPPPPRQPAPAPSGAAVSPALSAPLPSPTAATVAALSSARSAPPARTPSPALDEAAISGAVALQPSDQQQTQTQQQQLPPPAPLGPKVGLFGIFRFARAADWALILLATLCSLALALAFPLFSFTLGDTVDTLASMYGGGSDSGSEFVTWGPAQQAAMEKTVWMLLAIAGGTFLLDLLRRVAAMATSYRQGNRIRRLFFEAALCQEIAFYDSAQGGRVTTRLGNVQLIADAVGEKFALFWEYVFCVIASLALGFFTGPKMAGVLLSAFPLVVICTWVLGLGASRFSLRAFSLAGEAGSVAEETLSSIRTVTVLGVQGFVLRNYNNLLRRCQAAGTKKAFFSGLAEGAVYLLIFGTYALAFWYGSTLVKSGEMSVGDVVTVFFSVFASTNQIRLLMPIVNTLFRQAQSAAQDIYGLIDRSSRIDPRNLGGDDFDICGAIEFKNVSFAYPSRPDVRVLKDFSFTIDPGQMVAFIGPSGCGKSTLVGLLLRYYDLDEENGGELLVDGVPIRKLNVRSLREQIGAVTQEPVLFAMSIADNIAFGCDPRPSREDIEEAARRANLMNWINGLQRGFDTMLGERGMQISGGQKQRIAIARALVRHPKILIFDEATSALDNESEKEVQAAIDQVSQGITTIVIAHRLSTIQNANMIVVIKAGAIVEAGTPQDLYEEEGEYYRMLQGQQVRVADGEVRHRLRGKHPRTHTIARKDPVSGSPSLTPRVEGDIVIMPSPAAAAAEEGAGGEVEEPTPKKSATLMRAFAQMKPDACIASVAFFAAIIGGAVFPVFSLFFSEMLNSMALLNTPFEEKGLRDIKVYAFLMVGLGVFCGVVQLVQTSLMEISGERLARRLRVSCFRALLQQEIGFFDDKRNRVGTLTAQLATEASLIHSLIGSTACTLLQMISSAGVGIAVGMSGSIKITLAMLALTPILIIPSIIYMRSVTMREDSIKRSYEKSSKVVSEAVDSVRTVAMLCGEDSMVRRFVAELLSIPKRSTVVNAICASINNASVFAIFCLGMWYASVLLKDPDSGVTFADILTSENGIMYGVMGISDMAIMFPNYSRALLAANGIFRLLDRRPRIPPAAFSESLGSEAEEEEGGKASPRAVAASSPGVGGSQAAASAFAVRVPEVSAKHARAAEQALLAFSALSDATIPEFQGDVDFGAVCFSYPSRPGQLVLDNLSFHAGPQQTIALVGASGCGKSTVMALLERFYDPTGGAIMLDRRPIQQLSVTWLRSQMAMVSQEPSLFATSIKENIRMGKPGASAKEVVAAAKLANAHNFIMQFPQQYNTVVGSRGALLSGGQRQRIAIARALIRDPKILLLDEATSALDQESEKVVQAALDIARLGRTTIVIAHRLSTIKNADKIFVIDHGAAIEVGTHTGLMNAHGAYYKLATAQATSI